MSWRVVFSKHAVKDAGKLAAEFQSQRLVEFASHCVNRSRQPVGANFLKYHLYLVGLLTGLVQPVGFAEFHEHALGTG